MKVRQTVKHTDLSGTEWDYHEWWIVETFSGDGHWGSRPGYYTWLRVECNNSDCDGTAIIRQDVILGLLP